MIHMLIEWVLLKSLSDDHLISGCWENYGHSANIYSTATYQVLEIMILIASHRALSLVGETDIINPTVTQVNISCKHDICCQGEALGTLQMKDRFLI